MLVLVKANMAASRNSSDKESNVIDCSDVFIAITIFLPLFTVLISYPRRILSTCNVCKLIIKAVSSGFELLTVLMI